MELSDLYSEKILEIAANQPLPGRLAHPDASARRVSRVCGSSIEVDIALADGRIAGYGHALSACALGQTSAAIVATHIVGTPAAEFRALREAMVAMLKEGGPPPGGNGPTRLARAGARLSPATPRPSWSSTYRQALDGIRPAKRLRRSLDRFLNGLARRRLSLQARRLRPDRGPIATAVGAHGPQLPHAPVAEYTRDAIWRFGFWPGGWMGLARITAAGRAARTAPRCAELPRAPAGIGRGPMGAGARALPGKVANFSVANDKINDPAQSKRKFAHHDRVGRRRRRGFVGLAAVEIGAAHGVCRYWPLIDQLSSSAEPCRHHRRCRRTCRRRWRRFGRAVGMRHAAAVT